MNSSEKIKSYASSSSSIMSFMDNSADSWVIKDTESRWIYANNVALDLCNVEKGFDIEGKLDKEIHYPAQEMWESFVACDQRVVTENRKVSEVAIHYYGRGNVDNLVPVLSDKIPLYDEKKDIIGIVCYWRIIDEPTLLFYMNRFNRKTVQFDAPNDIFTKGELDVIFWAQQRLSAKEIAKRLNLAPRTVENKLSLIYEKVGVHSIIQFVEYCKQTGLDSYIPSDFVRKGVQLVE